MPVARRTAATERLLKIRFMMLASEFVVFGSLEGHAHPARDAQKS
jgi:hypothetical protein